MTNHLGKAFEDRRQEWALYLPAEREVVAVVLEIQDLVGIQAIGSSHVGYPKVKLIVEF